jgi:hypothetical protein
VSKDNPVLPATRTLVIRDTPTDELLEIRGLFLEQLGWGLSKQARKALEIKVGAIEYRLRERGVDYAQ